MGLLRNGTGLPGRLPWGGGGPRERGGETWVARVVDLSVEGRKRWEEEPSCFLTRPNGLPLTYPFSGQERNSFREGVCLDPRRRYWDLLRRETDLISVCVRRTLVSRTTVGVRDSSDPLVAFAVVLCAVLLFGTVCTSRRCSRGPRAPTVLTS